MRFFGSDLGRRARMVLVAGVAAAFCAGCGLQGGGSGSELSVGLSFGPDRGWAIETEDGFVLTKLGVVEPLTKVDFEGETQPGIAESWEQVDENTWSFRLREGAEFHNGEALDAAAVVASLEGALGLSAPPPGLEPEGLEVREAGPATVEIETERPDPILPQRLSSPNAGLLAPEAYEEAGGEESPQPFGMGSGPFEIPEEPEGSGMTLERFEGYYGEEPAQETIEAQFVEDPQTRSQMLQSGELDLAEEIPLSQIQNFQSEESLQVVTEDLSRIAYLATNFRAEPFEERQVREAVRLALDREELVESVMESSATPANGVFSPVEPWSEGEQETTPADPEQAQELLREAGYEPGELEVSLATYPGRSELPALAQAIQAQLSEAGVEVNIQISEYTALEPRVLDGEYDLFLGTRSYLIDVNDPSGFLNDDYSCEGSYNINGYCSEEFEGLMEELASTTGTGERHELFREAEELLREDVAGVPLFYEQARVAHDRSVTGFQNHPLAHYLVTPELAVTE